MAPPLLLAWNVKGEGSGDSGYSEGDAWRVETGFMEQLSPLLGGEPGERHLEVLAS